MRRRAVPALGAILASLLLGCAPSSPAAAPAKSAAAPAAPTAASAPSAASAPAASAPAASAPAAAAPASSATLQALIDAARREGQLNLVWAESVLGGSQMAPRLAEGFNKLYGLNLNVQFTPGANIVELGARLANEYQAGRPSSTDVFIGSGRAVVALMQVEALEAVDWMAWAPNVRNPVLVSPGGYGLELVVFQPGITYHAGKLTGDAVPTSLQDLLKPQYKGRIGTTPYAAFFDSLAAPEVWGEARTMEYVAKLSDQLAGLIGCGEPTRIVSGEFDALALDCGAFDAKQAQAQGAPVSQAIPSDAPLLFPWYLTVPKNAAHPAAAKLFANYMLSREGQDAVYQTHFSDHPLVEGSKIAPELEKARAAGLRFIVLDVAFRQRNDEKELDRITADIIRTFRSRS